MLNKVFEMIMTFPQPFDTGPESFCCAFHMSSREMGSSFDGPEEEDMMVVHTVRDV